MISSENPLGFDPLKVILILCIVVVVLLGLLGFSVHKGCSNSKDLQAIKGTLKSDLEGIKRDINISKDIDQALLKGQGELHLALYGNEEKEGIITKLDRSQEVMKELKKKLGERPEPKNPEELKTLEECQMEYGELKVSYELCLDLNDSKDDVLVLFGQVKENLTRQVSLLKGAVGELHNQVESWEKIEKRVMEGMNRLDKAYRLNAFWKTVKNVGVGAGAGAVLVFVLKTVLK